MKTNTPIHLAIPSYNNADGLRKLLPQVVTQNFASITVLDDASTDDTEALVSTFVGVEYVKAEKNGGPVAAKNLILRALPPDGYILFIDSDMEVVTQDLPNRLSDFIETLPKIGGGIGVIRTSDGGVMHYTKGWDLSPVRMFFQALFLLIYKLLPVAFGKNKIGRALHYFTLDYDEAISQKVDWVAEGFFFVRADLFGEFNGYYGAFKRNHEGPELCLRLRKAGYQIWSFSGIEVRHLDQNHGSSIWRRWQWWRSWGIYLFRHPSRLLLWGTPRP